MALCTKGRLIMRAAAAVSAFTLLAGCSTVDHFGGRVVEFNSQMQDTREKLILGNILRSGFDEPLQFSEVSTVSGQGSAQGGLGTVLPLFGPAGTSGARLFQLNPSLQVSGGPQVGVANLNTQEFFNGITTPLTMDQVATYVSNGQSRLSVLMLTVAAIDYDLDGKHYHFAGSPEDPDSFKSLQSVLFSLVNAKLAFERKETVSYVGPALTADEVFGRAVVQQLFRAPSDAKLPTLKHYSMTDPADELARKELSADDHARLRGAAEFYRLTNSETKTRPCFVAPGGAQFGYVVDSKGPYILSTPGIGKFNDVETHFAFGGDYICSSQDKGDDHGIKKLTFTFRSVRGIFTLLGAMARAELAQGKTAFDFGIEGHTSRLFAVERFAGAPDASPSTATVRITHDANDFSASTIQLLSEFVALNSAAKSFPTPSIVPFFTP